MGILLRLLRVAAALALAVTAGSLALLFLSPLAGEAIMGGLFRFLEALTWADNPPELVYTTVISTGHLLTLFTVAPVVLTGLVGEIAGWRASLWYVAGTALLTAAIPWLMRASLQTPTPGELRVTAYLAAAGAVSGTVYWLVAGAGRRPPVGNETRAVHE